MYHCAHKPAKGHAILDFLFHLPNIHLIAHIVPAPSLLHMTVKLLDQKGYKFDELILFRGRVQSCEHLCQVLQLDVARGIYKCNFNLALLCNCFGAAAQLSPNIKR